MDLITLAVLQHKFDGMADEMEIALLKSAYSSIVKEGMDASAALFTTGGETIAQAASIPIHLGSLVPAVQRILHEFPMQTKAGGNVYIMNALTMVARTCRVLSSWCPFSTRGAPWP